MPTRLERHICKRFVEKYKNVRFSLRFDGTFRCPLRVLINKPSHGLQLLEKSSSWLHDDAQLQAHDDARAQQA
jgi:hypothetical protein